MPLGATGNAFFSSSGPFCLTQKATNTRRPFTDSSPTVYRLFVILSKNTQNTHKFEKINGKCSHFTQNREKHGSVLNCYTFSSACSVAL
jgi:hypothetical protein